MRFLGQARKALGDFGGKRQLQNRIPMRAATARGRSACTNCRSRAPSSAARARTGVIAGSRARPRAAASASRCASLSFAASSAAAIGSHSASTSPPHSASATSSEPFARGAAPARGRARRRAACCARCAASSCGVSGGLSRSRQCSRNMSSNRHGARGDADRAEGIEVHQAHLDVLDAALAQRVQRALARPDHALRPDGAVELVLDLQQAGGELPIVVAVADADRLVRRIGLGERLVQRRGVALQIVVAHRERGLRVALVAEPPHAQRRRVRQVERVLAQALELVRRGRRRSSSTPPAKRRRGTAAATNGGGSCGSARSRHRWRPRRATRSCSGCPKSSACAGRSDARAPCGTRSSPGRRWSCRSGRSEWRRPPAGCRACSRTTAPRCRSRGRRTGESR